MRRRLVALHALLLGGLVAVAACFPDPPADDGLLDSGIFLSDGTVITPLPDGATNGLTLSSQTVDFGLSECGGLAPANQKLTLTNSSTAQVTYGVAIAGNQFSLAATTDGGVGASTTTGTIPPGQSVDVTLSALGVSAFATAGGLVEGAMQIVTDAPGQKLFVVDLKETAAGAELTMIPNMAGSVADFGLVPVSGAAQIDVSFRNNGNEPITISFDSQPFPPYTLENDDDAGEGFTVAANSTKTLKATFSPTGEDQTTQTVGFHTTGVTCGGGDPPAAIHLQGEESFSGVSIIPGTLTFDVGGTGFVPCGKVGTSQSVKVTNPTGGDVLITSTNITGPFTVSPGLDPNDAGAGIDIPAGGSQVLTITPQTVNAPQSTSSDGVSGSLNIVLDGGDLGDLTIQLSQTAQGAVLNFTQPSVDFGNAPLDFPTMQLLGVTNSGNAAVGLTLAVTGSPYFTVSPSNQFSVNTPGGSSTVTFLPIANGPANATLSLTPSGAVCGLPSPATVALTGNGSADAGAPDSGDDSGDDSGLIVDAGDDGSIQIGFDAE